MDVRLHVFLICGIEVLFYLIWIERVRCALKSSAPANLLMVVQIE